MNAAPASSAAPASTAAAASSAAPASSAAAASGAPSASSAPSAGSAAPSNSAPSAGTAAPAGRDDNPAANSGGSPQPSAGGVPAGAPAAMSCSGKSSSYKPGTNRMTLQHENRMRRYAVYVPTGLDAAQPVPLVLDFHGNTSSGAQEQSGSGWQQKADKEHFIAVYPDGVGNAWNVGNCCGQALNEKVDDVGFARALVKEVSAAACIDPKRVYATGISNGAGLAHRLACEAADVFAAIAAASADLVTDPCTPARPISELSVRGESDTLVAYAGGNTGSTGWYSPGAKGTLELWKKIDGCTGPIEKSLQYCETYTGCMGGVEVTLCSLPGTGHILYDNPVSFDVPGNAWEMFKRQPLP